MSNSNATSFSAINITSTAELPIDTVKRLIAAVKRRPILWFRKNQSLLKRSDSSQNWGEVARELNLPAYICRIKFSDLRDTFRKAYKRNYLSNKTPSSWRFYNDLRFLEHAMSENILMQARTGNRKHPTGNRSQTRQTNGSLKSDHQIKPQTQPTDLPYISVDATTNTDSNGGESQDDADRMFLLSLMPFLQKLNWRRKLRVRQKLQNVLIEELELG